MLQQVRMIVPGDQRHRFVIRDRDDIFSAAVDQLLTEGHVRRLLVQAAADGPCWCGVTIGHPTLTQHTAKRQRARTALCSGRLSRDAQREPAPGDGHGV
jgi:hypothetical protein